MMENSVASSAIQTRPIGGDGTGLGVRGQGARSLPHITMPMAPAARPNLFNLVIPRNGLELPRQMSYDTWLEVGRRLTAVATSSAWCLGDWLIYGEISFTGRYREAIERTSLDYQTLRNYAWVARKIPLSRRWEKLSFGHHAEVAALPEPEQDYWLRKAHEFGWSRNQIRHEIRESLRERNADMEASGTEALPGAGENRMAGPAREPAAPPELTIQMKVTPDQLDLFRQAANQDGYSIEDWALLILNHAAHGSLPGLSVGGAMRLGTLILPDKRWENNATRWRLAEELGFDSSWTYDHIWWRSLRDGPWFSAVPVLSAAAAVTGRMRLGLMVASPNFRHPVTMVKDAIAIDDISGGRFTLGVGAGASGAGDAEVLGGEPLPARERASRFAEFAELSSHLLDNPVVSYAGRHYSAKDARMIPGSVQRPRLPLAIAASGRAGIELAARYGDAWITGGPANWLGGYTARECREAVAEQATQLRRCCDRLERDFLSMERIMIVRPICGNPLESAKACRLIAEQYAEADISHLIIHWPRESGIFAGDERVLRDIIGEALPAIAAL